MTKKLERRVFMALAGTMLLAGCHRPPPDGTVRVSDVWVRLPATRKGPGGAYFRMEAGSEGTRLVGVSSPSVRRIELHETLMAGSKARMEEDEDVEFPSRGELVFEPGGRHAMLFGMGPNVKAGDRIPITFSFNVAPPITVEAEVRAAGDEAPHGRH
ncbi:MAG: periplasmic copper chaperone [Sphingomonadales bacterium]|jgi:copper(I)-binding protein|nr:periplasmic copper chaperone [Sphingomonadales bacterium]